MNSRQSGLEKASKGRQNQNLLPLMHLSRALLKVALADEQGRMLDMNLNVTLNVSVAAGSEQQSRYSVRCSMRGDRIHVLYGGMDDLRKYMIPNIAQFSNLADSIYTYLRSGTITKPVGVEEAE